MKILKSYFPKIFVITFFREVFKSLLDCMSGVKEQGKYSTGATCFCDQELRKAGPCSSRDVGLAAISVCIPPVTGGSPGTAEQRALPPGPATELAGLRAK